MFDCGQDGVWWTGEPGYFTNPARQTLAACGYDPTCYISTAQLVPSAYTSQALIQARLGGLIKLIEACDDSNPPIGDLIDDCLAVYNAVLQNVTTEINGYLSSIYPIPLAQTGTVAIIQITSVDSNGAVTGVSVVHAGNYQSAPNTTNSPAYLRYIDDECNTRCFGENWWNFQKGTGLSLTVAYTNANYSDESGQVLQAQTISGTPTIAAGGTNYQVNDLVVLTGGASFVPAKIREAMIVLVCHSLYQRRLSVDEKNIFDTLAKMWREKLTSIGNGDDEQLDGTYKRFFSIGAVWGQKSVLFGANSL